MQAQARKTFGAVALLEDQIATLRAIRGATRRSGHGVVGEALELWLAKLPEGERESINQAKAAQRAA